MRGAEGAEERGTEGAEEVGSGEGCPLPVGVGFGEGLCPYPRNVCKIQVEFSHFAAFCEDYDSLRLMKFTKFKLLYLLQMSSSLSSRLVTLA